VHSGIHRLHRQGRVLAGSGADQDGIKLLLAIHLAGVGVDRNAAVFLCSAGGKLYVEVTKGG
jgi:hypothetical protein